MSPSCCATEPVAEAPSFETPPLPPKGGGRLGRVSGGLAKVLCGPWARPRNPRRGFLTENSPLDYFPIFLRLPKATKAAGASPPHPHKPFEKGLSENFTCLYLTRARAFQLAALSKPRRLNAACATCPVRPRTAKCPAGPRAHRIVGGAYYGKENPIRRRYYGRKRMRP